ncbi:MAG TPA: MBOAT family O-acyltransferase [Puia sp.]|nr:MBOAT family O-acyltransferase [Puia sp.]
MLFNSLEFFVFLPIVFFLYWFVFNKSLNWQNLLILLASYVFYGWWDWRFLCLLVFSTLLDYSFGYWVGTSKNRSKLFLVLSILNNLLVLGIFKYYNFFATEAQHLLHSVGLSMSPYLIKVALPVGISFYTFHGMSYVFDIYRGKIRPVKSFVDYAVFVSFFPLLVAGPIERASHLLPQVQKPRVFSYSQGVQGLRLILWGLVKKVVIADSLAPVVDEIFKNYTTYSGSTLVLGALYFSIQIYGDFSGYSDIAIGTAKLFGFELFSNFRFPYFSRDIAEFWRRWHISLTSWFRDYLYIPLGGSRANKLKTVRNVFIIFLVSGFWHGASWNFIAWGAIHAAGFLPLLLLKKNRENVSDVVAPGRPFPSYKELTGILLTFAFVTFAWVFFRAETLEKAVSYLAHIGRGLLTPPTLSSFLLIYVLPFILADWTFRDNERNIRFPSNSVLRYLIYITLTFTIVYHMGNNTRFIYFQF